MLVAYKDIEKKRAYNRLQMKRIRDKRKGKNLCVLCGGQPVTGQQRCVVCKEVQEESRIKQVYGLTKEQHLKLLNEFLNSCGVCGRTDDLAVDHDHKTDKIRGILCRTHNRAIGLLGDSEELLLKAVEYLRRCQQQ